ncbi:hypothetical protein ABZ934_04675 [Streptomyces sp. NPDC046557]|uniref:hypothetical protein n=1 Tax=Streptomyces sp. NPDC046557 TaxID=3155372 RepID=UPI0034097DB2
MRRGIIAALVAGAAGVTLGVMPVSGAFAATLPQHHQQSSDHWRGNNSRDRDSSRGNGHDSDHRNNAHWNDNGNWNHDSQGYGNNNGWDDGGSGNHHGGY